MIKHLARSFTLPMLRRSLRIALVVGSVLNLINQWHAIVGDATVSWPHVALNYLVPFLVASYSAAANSRGSGSEEKSRRDGR